MKEIKFRAWHRGHGRMYPVRQINSDPESNLLLDTPTCAPGYIVAARKQCDLLQYTGLNDRSGKEIYEGDLCTLKGSFVRLIGRVYWDERSCDYRLAVKGDLQYDKTYPLNFAHTVIGNIWETPELLKQQ